MRRNLKLGIVGHGFVGKAVDYAFTTPKVEKFVVDPKYSSSLDDLADWQPDITFVCVPTPMAEDGSVDASIVQEAVNTLFSKTESFIVVKSTVTPNVIDELASMDSRIVYNPEFLQEGNANADFISAPFQIVGGQPEASQYLEGIYSHFSLCNPAPVINVSAVEASFIKYAINSFLAMKVTFFNELYDAVNSYGGSFTQVSRAVSADHRVGPSHTKVPGYDGKRGFGGACFPKDISAFNSFIETELGLTSELLPAIMRINNQYRSQYDTDEREKANNILFGDKS